MNKEQEAYHKGQANECVRILYIMDNIKAEVLMQM